ncbi:hypothetical protein ACFWGC_12990 [Cytobacillus pseudoceanisediminis]|uniref:hypothetical protein n=1 Tax=Cytobacillus pseudoceanisediminis TaxID=3051614 RepID=UPI003659259D
MIDLESFILAVVLIKNIANGFLDLTGKLLDVKLKFQEIRQKNKPVRKKRTNKR